MVSTPQSDADAKVNAFWCLNMMMLLSNELHLLIRHVYIWDIIILVLLVLPSSLLAISRDSIRIMILPFLQSLTKFMQHHLISLGVMQNSL